MNNARKTSYNFTVAKRRHRGTALLTGGLLLGGLLASMGAIAAEDTSLTWHGVTLYGIVDIGLQYDTHGAPINDYFPAGSNDIVQKDSNGSVFGATPNNLSQSRIGLKGTELITGDWSAVFKVETYFNPQSGDLSDALKSLTQNNGKPLASQSTNIDSSVAGQFFQQAFAGFSSPTAGTLTFGRQNTVLADGIAKYDPQGASQAFSVIGLSGTAAGGGDTQDRRLDSSLKYVLQTNTVHLGAQFKFNGASGGANTALEFNLGAGFPGGSIDAYYVKVNDAVSAAGLSAAYLAGGSTACPAVPAAGESCAVVNSSNAIAGTISDNTAYSLMATYKAGPTAVFAGYERIQYANPSTPLTAPFNDIGGYVLADIKNAAYDNDKILQVFWAGLKFSATPDLDLTAAYYGYRQNSFATGANTGCSTTASSGCSGALNGFSFSLDYRFSKRFDGYAGFMWTGVSDGLANGYTLNTNNIDPTIGVRYQF